MRYISVVNEISPSGVQDLSEMWMRSGLGLATEFRSEKIPRNGLGTDSVIPRKKTLIPRVFRVPRKTPFRSSERNGREFRGKICFRNSQNNFTEWFVSTSKVVFSGPIFEICGCRVLLWGTLLPGGLFPAGSGFRLRNSGKFTFIFVPRNGIPSGFLFRGMVRNGTERKMALLQYYHLSTSVRHRISHFIHSPNLKSSYFSNPYSV
jgi:hypothetical protein